MQKDDNESPPSNAGRITFLTVQLVSLGAVFCERAARLWAEIDRPRRGGRGFDR